MAEKRHTIQIKETLWERLYTAAHKESRKQGHTINEAEYVRRVLARHFNRKGK